jgi:7,8-didemethyl-8-hydroxy-5-deazariboflavin synthase CofH subunit
MSEAPQVPLEELVPDPADRASLDRAFAQARDRRALGLLEKALAGSDLDEYEVVLLFRLEGTDLAALFAAAHALRLSQAAEVTTYVVNRNINFTNICYNHCRFCAYSRPGSDPDAFFLGADEIVHRAEEAKALGATELCLQAGLAPDLEGSFYPQLCSVLRRSLPDMHIHAFSPQEIVSGARKAALAVPDYLEELKSAGLNSIPGTSAEILDDEIRLLLSPRRINVEEWTQVISSAHRAGLPSSATIMYGHIETSSHRARHLLKLRDLQRATGGFTEFVPLSLISMSGPPPVPGAGDRLLRRLTAQEVLKMHAIARLTLGRDLRNLQVSWVKEGRDLAQLCLRAGANDLGGTLIDERISSSAGGTNGPLMRPRELRRIIREAGFVPAQRTTLYEILRRFDDPAADPHEPLDDF